jgi:carboxypeptidase C (cathepsin A)
LESFSGRRIASIAEVLGDDETNAAVQQANANYGEDVDPHIWHVFLHGTPEERSALQEEIEREMLSKDTSEVKRNARL